MKHLLTFLRHDVSATLASTVGSPSAHHRHSALKHLAFMLLFLLGSLNVWGEEASLSSVSTQDVTAQGKAGQNTSVSKEFSGVTCTVTKKSNNTTQPGFYTKSGIVRYYSGDEMTLSVASGNNITAITFVMNSGTVGTASVGTLSQDNLSWSGSAQSVTFTGGATVKIKSIAVTYSTGGSTEPTPSLDHIAITGTPSKTYEEGQSFDPTGLTVTAYYDDETYADVTGDVEWSFNPATFTVAGENKSVTATATYEGEEDSKTYNDITVTEHVITPGEYTIEFNNVLYNAMAGTNLSSVPVDATVHDITVTTGGSGTKSRPETNCIRYYQNNTLTFAVPTGFIITDIKFAEPSSGASWGGSITIDEGTYTDASKSWAGEANSVTFTFGAQNRIGTATVKFEAEAADAPSVIIDPMEISLATPDAANGTINATYENIDLANVTVELYDNADCDEAFTGGWLTATLNGDKDIEYTIAANTGAARTAYIKLTAPASNGTSPDVVKIIEVSQAKAIPTYTALDAIFAAATGTDETVKVTFNNWVISALRGTANAYLTDGTYGLIIYTEGHGFNVGDVLSGTVQTTLTKFQGNAELKGVTATSDGLTVSAGGTISARVLDAAAVDALTGANAGSLIKISGECTEPTTGSYYINGIQLYNSLYSYETPIVGNVYDCTGIFVMYNSTKEILPRQEGDLVPSAVTPTAVITFEDFNIEKGQNTTLAATVAPAVAASAEVTYSIVDGGEYVSLVGNELTANEIGTAHIRATVADNLPNYYGATKDITVTVTAPDSRKTAVIDGITTVSGTLVTETAGTHKDKEYISYVAQKGDASNAPLIPSGKSFVRIYQNGGYLALNAVKGCVIDEVIVSIPSTCNSTTIAVGTDEENLPTSGGTAATAGNDFSTGTGLNSQNVYLVCRGTDKDHRLEVGAITVKYNGDPIEVSSIAVSGTYQTEFTKNATFNHDGAVVTATYTDGSHADVTTLAEFSDPDMSSIGQKEITVSYGGKSTSYNIEVVAATLTEIALSGTYPTRFHVGDAFSHTGMTVTASYSDYSEEDVTDDATFSGYDMSVGGTQTVTVEYGGQSAQYSIIVVPANTDVITADVIGVEGTSYANWSGKTGFGTTSVYAGNSTNGTGEKAGAIQLRYDLTDDTKRAGIVLTTSNGLYLKGLSVTVKSGTNTLNIYAKNTPYTSHADLSSDDEATRGKLIGTVSATGEMTLKEGVSYDDNYQYIGMRSNSGALYLSSIMITWGDASVTPTKEVIRGELSAGKWGTLCPKQTVENVEGATFYQIAYLEEQGGLPYNVVFDEISGTTLTAGQPYFFIAKGEEIKGIKTGAELDAAAAGVNGFYGYIGASPLALPNINAEYTAGADNTFVIYNNSVFRINSATNLKSERCYININASEPTRTPSSANPIRRRIVMGVQNTNTATGMDELNASEAPRKMIIDGKMYIIRGEKMYDAKGQLVK